MEQDQAHAHAHAQRLKGMAFAAPGHVLHGEIAETNEMLGDADAGSGEVVLPIVGVRNRSSSFDTPMHPAGSFSRSQSADSGMAPLSHHQSLAAAGVAPLLPNHGCDSYAPIANGNGSQLGGPVHAFKGEQ